MFEFDIERLMRMIYAGKVTPFELPAELYYAIADYLKKGLYQGFGITFGELTRQIETGISKAFDETDLELLAELRENVYIFSAAKTHAEIKDFRGALVGEDGQVKPFKQFRDEVLQLNEQHNVNWIKTEYETAYGQAQSAVRWNEIEKDKDVLPFLKYSAVMDGRTSDICAPLNGVTLPVEHPFWSQFMPLNHFNCRCTVEQLDEAKVTGAGEVSEAMKATGSLMDESGQSLFRMNPGQDRIVFMTKGADKHPYFDVEKQYKGLAKRNFDLPIPERDN